MTEMIRAQIVCRFKFSCPLKWFQLQEQPNDPMIRHCHQCQEPVYRCDDYPTLRKHVAEGHCIAVNLHGDMHQATLGIVAVDEAEIR